MTWPSLIWGSKESLALTLGALGVGAIAIAWSYARARARPSARILGPILKGLGFAAVALALLEPLLSGTRPRKGANAFVILADNSQSLLIKDDSNAGSRGDWVRELLRKESPWRTRLGQDFDVRSYVFDSHLRGIDSFEALSFDGVGSAIPSSLSALAKRFKGLPLAGVLLVTDGNSTDLTDVDWSALPPVYPVVPPSKGSGRDLSVTSVSVTQSNFEAAPVVIRADVAATGFRAQPISAVVTDEAGAEVERLEAKASLDGKPTSFRFQFRPLKKGVTFYKVTTSPRNADPSEPVEQTQANNSRLVVVDQGGGPYRVLYVSGRPNWEFKFLRRAVADDEQLELVGLLRIARRQPKFDFRDSRNRTKSQLYDGFDNADPDTAERADQPVLVRLGIREGGTELRDGFPKTAEELYAYHAIVIDDLEAAFFTQDQLGLLRNFVSVRGGGLLMLGGPDAFVDGKYDRTPVGEMLPVYLDKASAEFMPPEGGIQYRLELTKEGWLQPWVRTRKTEDDEQRRLNTMGTFQSLSKVGGAKPGAVVLAEVRDVSGEKAPALVAQQFGKGRVGAMLIGDLWRWGLRRLDTREDDLDRSWRQTVRWLVGDVPSRLEVEIQPKAEAQASAVDLTVRVRDAEYRPLDNAKVSLKLSLPGDETLTLDAEPAGTESGVYAASYVPKTPGAYRVVASATAPDGSAIAEREAGWAAQPSADEFARLEPNREFLKTIAAKSNGEVVDGDKIAAFVSSLSSRDAPITEPWTSPLWHQPIYFLIAIACLVGEWGLRRVNGLA
jgi:uncharacterized membrane protein